MHAATFIQKGPSVCCMGCAMGEAGAQGKRGALPSSTIMLRQPMQRFTQMQASDIDIYRNELRKTKNEIVSVQSSYPVSPCLVWDDAPLLVTYHLCPWLPHRRRGRDCSMTPAGTLLGVAGQVAREAHWQGQR